MDCVAQLPMWAQPVISASFGAAQFGSSSTIELMSRIPNIFGNDGDYIEFKFFQDSASAWTVFGSTASPDAIVLNDNTITITDGTTSDSITLLASLSTTEWNHIRLIRNGSTIECYVATGSDSLVLELQTLDVIPIDIDIFGKNQAAYDDVYAIQFRSGEHGYLSKATPSTLQGDGGEWFGKIAFTLDELGNHCLVDNLSGNNGYRIEIENIYLYSHKLKWTVGDGTTTYTKLSEEVFYVGDTVEAVLDIEDLGETTPGASDTTFEGDWSPNSGTAYVGAQAGTSNFAGLRLHQLITGNTGLSSSQRTFILTAAFDEITVGSTVATGDCTNAYIFNETSGTRSDSIGTDDLSETPGELVGSTYGNGGFETVDGGTFFEDWTIAGSASNGDWSQEASIVNAGSYAAKLVATGSAPGRQISPNNISLKSGQTYDVSVYVGCSDATNTPRFSLFDTVGSTAIIRQNLSVTSYTELTGQYTPSVDTGVYIRFDQDMTGVTGYVDDVTISANALQRVLGINTSYLSAAVFTGYLRNVQIHTLYFDSSYSLATDASDSLSDGNDGTASNVTFVTEDPSA